MFEIHRGTTSSNRSITFISLYVKNFFANRISYLGLDRNGRSVRWTAPLCRPPFRNKFLWIFASNKCAPSRQSCAIPSTRERERERERITENEKSVSILSSRIESRMHGKRGTRAWMRKINSADVTSWIGTRVSWGTLLRNLCVSKHTLAIPYLSLNVIWLRFVQEESKRIYIYIYS